MPDDDSTYVDEAGLQARNLSDPRAMRALAHPRRLELLELLHRSGALTATQCADALGDSPAGCSYHLRQLARYGFVEEAPGGVGRERPWRRVKAGLRFSTGLDEMSPAQRAAADLLVGVVAARRDAWVAQWRATRDRAPRRWREASAESDFGFWATPDEVEQLNAKIYELLAPFQQRTFDEERPRDGEAELVTYLVYAFPQLSAAAGATAQPDATGETGDAAEASTTRDQTPEPNGDQTCEDGQTDA